MKRDCPLNVSRPTYGATASSPAAAPAHTIGSVAQLGGRGAQSDIRGQKTGGEDKPELLC